MKKIIPILFIAVVVRAEITTSPPLPPKHSPTPQQWIDGGGDLSLTSYPTNEHVGSPIIIIPKLAGEMTVNPKFDQKRPPPVESISKVSGRLVGPKKPTETRFGVELYDVLGEEPVCTIEIFKPGNSGFMKSGIISVNSE